MDKFIFKESNDRKEKFKKGEWCFDFPFGEVKAKCPQCGCKGSLRTHKINSSGVVMPSLVCPNEKCNFHKFVILEGYKPPDKDCY